MGLRSWWKRLRASGRFDPARAAGRIPAVTIRQLRDDDVAACHSIYHANADGRFPDGYFAHFEADLRKDNYLWLVVEDGEEVVGVGGICLHEYPPHGSFGFLAFGMVRPDRHRKGLGSALLLARLAALSAPDGYARVGMTSIPSTVEFYRSYGFKYVGRVPQEDGNEFDTYYTVLTRPSWEACRALLISSGITFDPERLVIPETPLEI